MLSPGDSAGKLAALVRAVMRVSAYAVAVLVGVAAGNACLLDLDHRLTCGDGYIDPEAGEECEPDIVDSYINACVGTIRPAGDAACDPVTCTIDNDRMQCAECGDGIVDSFAGEECELDKIGVSCPTSGPVNCVECKLDFSQCDKCGNGVLDAGEECDPAAGVGIGVARTCTDLKSPYQTKAYSSGQAIGCLPDCTFNRIECGYCGNGELEENGDIVSLPTQPMTMSRPEVCDGEDLDKVELAQEYPCGEGAIGNVTCSDDCLDFVRREIGPDCCLDSGADCPADGEYPRCCHEFSDPDVEEHCSDIFAPTEAPADSEGGSKCN